eukprot:CAMPEP_0206141302 /NCGR_PEP_ID=MMETSP1473-20131121/12493_1 /ASSEMBLY_ACC=CAM_ASM_001109 /TAXON_ID=1461547 /ORGANISM="Stichococcus sp, Strain RCC1054" /LENGTH=146 /DNA_ID=CAMNT_0053535817 /DNA_START=140 /DNA_END=580 /DNA_ORIENTATION=+
MKPPNNRLTSGSSAPSLQILPLVRSVHMPGAQLTTTLSSIIAANPSSLQNDGSKLSEQLSLDLVGHPLTTTLPDSIGYLVCCRRRVFRFSHHLPSMSGNVLSPPALRQSLPQHRFQAVLLPASHQLLRNCVLFAWITGGVCLNATV